MVSSISFGQAKSASGDKLKNAVKDKVESIHDKIDSPETEKKVDAFIFSCTDGRNDGKIGFGEGVKAFGAGAVENVSTKIKGLKEDVIDQPVRTLTIGGIGIAALSGLSALLGAPFVFSAIGTLGFLYGAHQVGKSTVDMAKSIKHLKNAKTDAEAKSAISNMGADTVDIGVNSLLMVNSFDSAKGYATSLITKKKPSVFSSPNKTKIKVSSNPVINNAAKVPTRSSKRIDLDETFGNASTQSKPKTQYPVYTYEQLRLNSARSSGMQFYA